MRAVTWTQVAQYLILIIAYLVPVAILSYKVTGVPIPRRCMAGAARSGVKELELFSEPRENEVRARYRADEYARKIADLPESLAAERIGQVQRVTELRTQGAPAREIAGRTHPAGSAAHA
jgi:cation/acetate symporter